MKIWNMFFGNWGEIPFYIVGRKTYKMWHIHRRPATAEL